MHIVIAKRSHLRASSRMPANVNGTNGWVYRVDPRPTAVGSFSNVHQCTCNGRSFVIKRQLCYKNHIVPGYDFFSNVCTNLDGLSREVAIYFSDTLSNENTKHLARLHDIAQFQNQDGDIEQVLVFEHANAPHNTLRRWLRNHGCLDEDHATTLWLRLSFGIQIFSALVELHDGVSVESSIATNASDAGQKTQQRYIHQDVKPQNLILFIDDDVHHSDRVALTDFGLTTQLRACFEVSGCRRARADGVYVELQDVQPHQPSSYQNQHFVKVHYVPSQRMWVIDDPEVEGYSYRSHETDAGEPPLDSAKWTSCRADDRSGAPFFQVRVVCLTFTTQTYPLYDAFKMILYANSAFDNPNFSTLTFSALARSSGVHSATVHLSNGTTSVPRRQDEMCGQQR